MYDMFGQTMRVKNLTTGLWKIWYVPCRICCGLMCLTAPIEFLFCFVGRFCFRLLHCLLSLFLQLNVDLEADASIGVKNRHALFYDVVQTQEKTLGPTIQTIYPNNVPKTYEIMMSPIRLVWDGVPQTLVLVNGHEKSADTEVQHDLQRAIEMQRHSKALVMLFRCSDGQLLSYSPSAHDFYNRCASCNLLVLFA